MLLVHINKLLVKVILLVKLLVSKMLIRVPPMTVLQLLLPKAIHLRMVHLDMALHLHQRRGEEQLLPHHLDPSVLLLKSHPPTSVQALQHSSHSNSILRLDPPRQ